MTPTFTPARPIDDSTVPLTWLSPEATLWVASRRNDFAGLVELIDGHLDVTDARGAHVASCGTLYQAQDLVEHSTRRVSVVRMLAYVAVGMGIVAVSVLAVGLSIVNLG